MIIYPVGDIVMPRIRSRSRSRRRPYADPRIEGVMGGAPGLRVLCEMGVRMMGLDHRPAWQTWGETSCYLIFIVVHGRLFYPRPNGTPLRAGPGQALLLPAEASKRVETHAEPVTVIWIHLEHNGALLKTLGLPPQAEVRPFPQADLICAVMESLLTEQREQHPESGEACATLCQLLFHYLQRQLGAHETMADREFRSRFTRLMEDIRVRPGEAWSVSMLARALNISAGHLHRRVRQLYAQTPAALLRGVRLASAAELLRTTDDKIEVIASRVGYSNAYNFSQAFHRGMGLRPGRYRRRLRD